MVETTKDTAIVQANNLNTIAQYLGGNLKPDDFQEFVTIGVAAREMADLSRWVIGKLAFDLVEKWGRGRLKEFCDEIGYKGEIGTVNQYRWVVEHYIEPDGRLPIDILEGERLSFSFYRAAAKTEKPQQWLEVAQDESLTVSQLRKRIAGGPAPEVCGHTHLKTITICEDCGIRIESN